METVFHLPTRIVFGIGTIEALGRETGVLGKNALIVTGTHSSRATGLLDRVIAMLAEHDVAATVFDRITPNPDYGTIDEGAAIVRNGSTDVIIGLGGGSAMDAAKAIRLAAATGRPIWEHVIEGTDAGVRGAIPQLLLVPTMAGTGSEASIVSVVVNPELHEKRALRTPLFYPTVSIVDPQLTVTVPPHRTAEGSIDMFCHVFEPYITAGVVSEISDGFMETVMRAAVRALPEALKNPADLDARTRLSWASTLALSGVMKLGGSSGFFSCHGFAQALNGHYRGLGHGATLAYMLPAWLDSLKTLCPERLAKAGRAVFEQDDAVPAILDWIEKAGMRTPLREVGVAREDLAAIAESAWNTQAMVKKHPGGMTPEGVLKMYEAVY